MNWNIFRRWKEHRQQKRAQKEQYSFLQTWRWLEQLFDKGVLSFDDKQHRLFITQPFAIILLANGADGWVNSIHNIYQYTYLRATQQAWEDYMHQEELAAVRTALNAGKDLKREDIERIKWSRRQQIAFSDMESPKVEPFEFFIIPDSTLAMVEPLAVGSYDPNTEHMEVATWDEVKTLLNQ